MQRLLPVEVIVEFSAHTFVATIAICEPIEHRLGLVYQHYARWIYCGAGKDRK